MTTTTFYHTDLHRIIDDLTQEYEADEPDWERVGYLADDLTALVVAARKDIVPIDSPL